MNQLETIGIDFGGTNTRVAHFEGDRILKLIEFATPRRPEEFIEEFGNKIQAIKLDKVTAAAVGACGFWDKDCILRQSINLPDYINYPVWQKVSEIIERPVLVKSDVELAVMGEAIYGLANQFNPVLYINMGTGFSGALFKDNEIFSTDFSPTLRLEYLVQPEYVKDDHSDEDEAEFDEETKNKKSIALLSTTLINLSFILSPQIISIGGGKITDERWSNIIKPAIDRALVYLDENLTYKIQIRRSQTKYPAIYGAHELIKRNLKKLSPALSY
jgi:predicted NBD/HSP70 family sugar kinase